MRLISAIILLSVAAAPCLAEDTLLSNSNDSSAVIIGSVTVENRNVFAPSSADYDRWYASYVNRFHMKTRRHVIARELLFSVGDTLLSQILAETERNLRRYVFLDSVSVRADVSRDTARVSVYTDDNWTLGASMILEGGGGRSEIGALVVERNLFGLGKELNFQAVRAVDKDTLSSGDDTFIGYYQDPRLWGSRWSLASIGSHASTGDLFSLSISRPFYALDVRWGASVRSTWYDGITRQYKGGNLRSELPTQKSSASVDIARRWGGRSERITLSTAVAVGSKKYHGTVRNSTDADTLRTERQIISVSVGLGWMSDGRYLKLRRIDDFGRIEDVTEGFSASASVGVARGFGVTSDLLYPSFGGSVSQVSAWGEHLLVANGSGSVNLTDDRSKNRNGWSSGRLSGFVHYYYLGLPWQTAAASVRYVGLYRPLRPAQLFLGGDVGLRGYPAWQFTGTKALLVNLEDRVFTPLKLYTFAMGLVLFADGGYVWPEGEELSARDIHASVGIGIRIGATKAATGRISRLDLAFPLRDGFGFSLTFGSDQVFNIMGIPAR